MNYDIFFLEKKKKKKKKIYIYIYIPICIKKFFKYFYYKLY